MGPTHGGAGTCGRPRPGLRHRGVARTVPTRRLIGRALLLCLLACSDDPTVEQLPADQVIRRILEHCHGARLGQFGACTLELHSSKQAMQYCSLQAPGNLRISVPRGRQSLVRDGKVWTWRLMQDAVKAEGQELADLRLLADLLRQMFLAPLYAKRKWQHLDARNLIGRSADGEEWQLEYRNDVFEPTKLTGPKGSVDFLASTSGNTRIPTRVRLDRLGEFTVKVVSAGQAFEPGMFELPNQRTSKGRMIVYGQTSKPKVPEFQKIRAKHWLIIPDPGEWAARKTLCNTSGRMLYAAGQSNAGDTFFFTEEGEPFMVIPFKSDPERGNKAFTPAGELQVRKVDAQTAAVVYAPEGELAERIAAGRELLDKFLDDQSLTASGPLRMVVNFYSSLDPSIPQDRRRMPLRLELPVAN